VPPADGTPPEDNKKKKAAEEKDTTKEKKKEDMEPKAAPKRRLQEIPVSSGIELALLVLVRILFLVVHSLLLVREV
jgi:hypothetical protein